MKREKKGLKIAINFAKLMNAVTFSSFGTKSG